MIKRLIKCIREYKKETILTLITITLEVIMEIIIPLIIAKLVDLGIQQVNMNAIYKFGLILVVSACLSLTFGVIAAKKAAKASAGFAKNLRKDMFYNVQNYSFFNIDKFSTASIITRLTTDVTRVQNAFQMIIRIAVRAPLMLALSIIMVFIISRKLFLIFAIVVPFLAISLITIIKYAHPIFEKMFKMYDKLNSVVEENVRGIRVVKSFVLEEEEKEKFGNISQTLYKGFVKANILISLNSPLMQFAMYSGMLAISYFGAKLIVINELSTGQLMSLMTYALQILSSLMMVSMIFVMLIISKASAERVVEILDEKSNLKNCDNPIMNVSNGDIEFKNVDFSYTNDINKLCLKNINLSIKSGETVGIIGGTGSSKSSLIQLIPRLYDVTNGEILVAGINVKKYDLEVLRNEISVVLQKNELFSGTIKDNLKWGNENATDEEIQNACILSQADEFIQKFPNKYETIINQGGVNVSGGQKQRLCIARALLKKPKILILDDSTSAVDTKTDMLIQKAFKESIPNITKIIIAQRINSIQNADKIIVLNNGKIDGVGKHEELLNNNKIYQEVYYSQVKGGVNNE